MMRKSKEINKRCLQKKLAKLPFSIYIYLYLHVDKYVYVYQYVDKYIYMYLLLVHPHTFNSKKKKTKDILLYMEIMQNK